MTERTPGGLTGAGRRSSTSSHPSLRWNFSKPPRVETMPSERCVSYAVRRREVSKPPPGMTQRPPHVATEGRRGWGRWRHVGGQDSAPTRRHGEGVKRGTARARAHGRRAGNAQLGICTGFVGAGVAGRTAHTRQDRRTLLSTYHIGACFYFLLLYFFV